MAKAVNEYRLDIPLSLMLSIRASTESEAIAMARSLLDDTMLSEGADTDYVERKVSYALDERIYYCPEGERPIAVADEWEVDDEP